MMPAPVLIRSYLHHKFALAQVVSWTAARCRHYNLHRPLSLSLSDPSAPGAALQQDCREAPWHQPALHVAAWHNAAGAALWPGGERGSMAVAALALITLTSSHYGSPWGDADGGTRAVVWSASPSQCGGGDAHHSATRWWAIKEACSSKTELSLSSVGCRGNFVL